MNKFDKVYRSIIKEAKEGTSISIKPVLKKITKIEDLRSGILLSSTTCSHVFYEINSVYKQGDKIKFYWKAQYRFSPDLKQYLNSSTGDELLQPRPFTFDEVQEYYKIVDKATTEKIKALKEFEPRQTKTSFTRKKANFDSYKKQKEEEQKRKEAAQWEAQQRWFEQRREMERREDEARAEAERERREYLDWNHGKKSGYGPNSFMCYMSDYEDAAEKY